MAGLCANTPHMFNRCICVFTYACKLHRFFIGTQIGAICLIDCLCVFSARHVSVSRSKTNHASAQLNDSHAARHIYCQRGLLCIWVKARLGRFIMENNANSITAWINRIELHRWRNTKTLTEDKSRCRCNRWILLDTMWRGLLNWEWILFSPKWGKYRMCHFVKVLE